jgi:hypothetical protein
MKVIKEVSDVDKEVFRFFSPHQPCWFEGCEKLREQYQAELDKRGGSACPSCEKGVVIRMFVPKIKKALGYE